MLLTPLPDFRSSEPALRTGPVPDDAGNVGSRSSALDQVDSEKEDSPARLYCAARSNPRRAIPKMMPVQMV